MLALRKEVLSKVKPRKHCQFLWLPLLENLDILYLKSWKARDLIKKTIWILHMIMFDLSLPYEEALNIAHYLYVKKEKIPSIEFEANEGPKMDQRETTERLKTISLHAEQFMMQVLFRSNRLDEEELAEDNARISLMKRICELSLVRDDPYVLQYRYDTPETYQVHTYADNTIVFNERVHIFENGKVAKSFNKQKTCHWHGLKQKDPRWTGECRHFQCVGCGLLYDAYYSDEKSLAHKADDLTFIGKKADPQKLTIFTENSGWDTPVKYANGTTVKCFLCDQFLYKPQIVNQRYSYLEDYSNYTHYGNDLPDSTDRFCGGYLDLEVESEMKKIISKSVDELVEEETVFIKRGLPKTFNTADKIFNKSNKSSSDKAVLS